MNIRAQIGDRIRQFRRKKSMTIEELAFKSGVHSNYLGDIERGARNPSIESLLKISKGLGVKIGSFFQKAIDNAIPVSRRDETYRFSRTIISLLKDKSHDDRRFIISMVKRISAKIK